PRGATDVLLVLGAHAPVDADPAQAEGIATVGQGDPAVAVRRLFEVADQFGPVGVHHRAPRELAQRGADDVVGMAHAAQREWPGPAFADGLALRHVVLERIEQPRLHLRRLVPLWRAA